MERIKHEFNQLKEEFNVFEMNNLEKNVNMNKDLETFIQIT